MRRPTQVVRLPPAVLRRRHPMAAMVLRLQHRKPAVVLRRQHWEVVAAKLTKVCAGCSGGERTVVRWRRDGDMHLDA